MHQQQTAFKNIVGKEETSNFFFFPKIFSTHSDNCTPFVNMFDIISLLAAELEEPKIGR